MIITWPSRSVASAASRPPVSPFMALNSMQNTPKLR